MTKIFGIEPVTEDLYRIALTHSSYTKDSGLPYTECYERLEFLGDAVLKLTMSDVLYKMYPEATEGELSKIRGIVVSDSTLAKVAKHDGLQDMIILSRHEEKQHIAENDSVCACAYEAILGAYYLDGKLDELIKYINKLIRLLLLRYLLRRSYDGACIDYVRQNDISVGIIKNISRDGS